jgi:hypothetical protein
MTHLFGFVLTDHQLACLRAVAWGTKHFDGGLVTNRQVPIRTVRKLVARGLVESAGIGPMCDGDCFIIEPERYRQGWKLTSLGKQYLERRT